MNMMNHLCHPSHHHNNDDDHANDKLYMTTTTTTTTTWDEHLNMIMKQHPHHHHQVHHDDHNQQAHEEQHLIPLLDQVWPNYQHLHTSNQSQPSIQLPTTSSSPLIINQHHNQVEEIHPHHQELLVEEYEIEEEEEDEEEEELGAMKEMMYRIAVMQPIDIDPATIRKPKRRNVRISDDPQSVAARLRRERISEKIRILQRLVPGGTKLDTASMLDEAVRYVKFLKRQIRLLQKSPAPPNHIPLLSSDWLGHGPRPGPSTGSGPEPGPCPSLAPILEPALEESKVVGNMTS